MYHPPTSPTCDPNSVCRKRRKVALSSRVPALRLLPLGAWATHLPGAARGVLEGLHVWAQLYTDGGILGFVWVLLYASQEGLRASHVSPSPRYACFVPFAATRTEPVLASLPVRDVFPSWLYDKGRRMLQIQTPFWKAASRKETIPPQQGQAGLLKAWKDEAMCLRPREQAVAEEGYPRHLLIAELEVFHIQTSPKCFNTALFPFQKERGGRKRNHRQRSRTGFGSVLKGNGERMRWGDGAAGEGLASGAQADDRSHRPPLSSSPCQLAHAPFAPRTWGRTRRWPCLAPRHVLPSQPRARPCKARHPLQPGAQPHPFAAQRCESAPRLLASPQQREPAPLNPRPPLPGCTFPRTPHWCLRAQGLRGFPKLPSRGSLAAPLSALLPAEATGNALVPRPPGMSHVSIPMPARDHNHSKPSHLGLFREPRTPTQRLGCRDGQHRGKQPSKQKAFRSVLDATPNPC